MHLQFNRIFLVSLVALLTSACGGGSGGENPAAPAQQTGRVTIALSDAPASAEFSEIRMVIREIRFLGPGGQDSLVLAEPREIDFLQLRNFSEVLIRRDVATGTINKIRLILDSLTLVRPDGSTESVRLTGIDKIDLNPRGPITVRAGDDILIDIEVDLEKAIHIVGNGNNRYRFRPVIFVRVSSEPAFDKLFRVEGTVDEIFAAATAFSLCDLRRVSDDAQRPNPREICIRVDPDAQTRYFDGVAEVAAGGFSSLVMNDRVVVYGKFDPLAMGDTLVPSVVARGADFERVLGVVATGFDPISESFDIDVTNGLCVAAPDVLRVGVVESAPVYVESEDGAVMGTRADILACREAEAEGFMVTDPADEHLRAFTVLLAEPAPESVTGTLTLVTGREYDLAPTGGGALECVFTTDSTTLTRIQTVDDVTTVTQMPFATAPTGPVTVVGDRDSAGCIVAEQVVHVI